VTVTSAAAMSSGLWRPRTSAWSVAQKAAILIVLNMTSGTDGAVTGEPDVMVALRYATDRRVAWSWARSASDRRPRGGLSASAGKLCGAVHHRLLATRPNLFRGEDLLRTLERASTVPLGRQQVRDLEECLRSHRARRRELDG
jgi:hypothetical protein